MQRILKVQNCVHIHSTLVIIEMIDLKDISKTIFSTTNEKVFSKISKNCEGAFASVKQFLKIFFKPDFNTSN